MFALSSNNVQPYMCDILREIGKTLNGVPNRLVVQGPYRCRRAVRGRRERL